MAYRITLAFALVALAWSPLSANGRFPATTSVSVRPNDDRTLLVGTTFGVLLSTDDGATWRWMCETSVGYTGRYDPTFAITQDGAMLAATYQGLSISRDGGCSWSFAGDVLAGHWISDVFVASDGSIWASTASTGFANDLFVSRDNGMTFASTGLLVTRSWWKTVRVAPSDPMRVYVSGYQLDDPTTDGGDGIPRALLYRSSDGGMTWLEIPFDFLGESQLLLSAVSPGDPDLLFARVDRSPNDVLLRSQDGGVSWEQMVEYTDDLLGVVARADGSTVIAGATAGGTELHGDVSISPDNGDTWVRDPEGPKMACLAERSDGELFSCGNNWTPDRFAIGRSTDGTNWSKVVRFCELDGPLECPAGSPQQVMCDPMWPMYAETFGTCAIDAGPTIDSGPRVDGGGGGNGNGCGCGISLALVFVVLPRRARRRRAP